MALLDAAMAENVAAKQAGAETQEKTPEGGHEAAAADEAEGDEDGEGGGDGKLTKAQKQTRHVEVGAEPPAGSPSSFASAATPGRSQGSGR